MSDRSTEMRNEQIEGSPTGCLACVQRRQSAGPRCSLKRRQVATPFTAGKSQRVELA